VLSIFSSRHFLITWLTMVWKIQIEDKEHKIHLI
jgi:hypothetical protein